MYLRVRQGLNRERNRNRKANRETRKLQRALMPLDDMRLLSGSSATLRCECCFAIIKMDEYGDTPREVCKEGTRVLCSNCCFPSEEAP